MDRSLEDLLEQVRLVDGRMNREEHAIAETNALLEKVDRRRRENPGDRRRWDSRANDLEEALIDSRRRLSVAEQRIVDLNREIDSRPGAVESAVAAADEKTASIHVPSDDGARPAEVGVSEKDSKAQGMEVVKRVREAAQQLLDTPRFKLSDLPLQELVLAKMFRESKASASMGKARLEELTQRIKICERSVEHRGRPSRPLPSRSERRQQLLIRRALEKCRTNQLGALTLHEIEIIIGCYDLLVQKVHRGRDDDRLLGLINDAIDKVCASWSRLEKLSEMMGAREDA